MPLLSEYKITPPPSSEEFEKICKDYLKNKYSTDTQLWGRKVDNDAKLQEFVCKLSLKRKTEGLWSSFLSGEVTVGEIRL